MKNVALFLTSLDDQKSSLNGPYSRRSPAWLTRWGARAARDSEQGAKAEEMFSKLGR